MTTVRPAFNTWPLYNSLDLALVTGRRPEVVTDLEGRGPLVRVEDAVQLGYRAKTLDPSLDEHIRDTAQIAIYNPTLDAPDAPLAARIVDLLAAGFT